MSLVLIARDSKNFYKIIYLENNNFLLTWILIMAMKYRFIDK